MNAKIISRCEVLWHFYDKERKKHVERWLPANLLGVDCNGRCTVECDNGFWTNDAAPECVRFPVPQVRYVPESVETATGKALADYYDRNPNSGD